ncbi:hypothetical protein [uncultured Microbacterium sp.]|uniref:hypothetical protein n=1 Tax=uncultured Microbacterium sp. TaxID=191216 RepID=UPI002601265E|nr:hypothetical protein [uncultured Microbacterium sp.]
MVPLIDGRSPFDSPDGARRAETDASVRAAQSALTDVDTREGRWDFVALRGSDDCEGACNLHLEVQILPGPSAPATSPAAEADAPDPSSSTDPSASADGTEDTVIVPSDVLRDVLVATVPVAEHHRVNVTVVGGEERDRYGRRADLSAACRELWGDPVDRPDHGASFWVGTGDRGIVTAFTRTRTGVLADMHLN